MKMIQTSAGRLTMPHLKMMVRLKRIERTSQKTLQTARAEETDLAVVTAVAPMLDFVSLLAVTPVPVVLAVY